MELCDNPGEGGTTPSLGMIEWVRSKINIDLMVMIRPRGSDFAYSADEFEIMKRDVMSAKRVGADGVVFGILKKNGRVDTERCTELIQLARPMSVTCHRAFDMTRDLSLSLEECISCGFDRILTSGGKAKAIDGLNIISDLNAQANGRIDIMPGSGIDVTNVQEILRKTNVGQIHLSASVMRLSEMEFRNPTIEGMGANAGSEYKIRTVETSIIQKIISLTSAV